MLADPSSNSSSSYDPVLIPKGCGIYERLGGNIDGSPADQAYLYEADSQLTWLPTADELKSLKGTTKRVVRNGKRITKRTPSRLYLPLVVDTEYQTLPNRDKYPAFYEWMVKALQRIDRGSLPITVQVNTIRPTGIGIGTYVHPLYKQAIPRSRPIVPAPKHPIEAYLQKLFPGASIRECAEDDESLRSVRNVRAIRLDLYAHFAVADFLKCWPAGYVHDHLIKLATAEEPTIDQQRRLKVEHEYTFPNGSVYRTRWTQLPAVVKLNGVQFSLEMSIVDTSAMAGQAGFSLAGFHACAGVPLAAKDNYRKDQKELMLLQFAAACDPEGIEKGAYAGVSKTLPGKLDEALIACGAYSTGNLFLDYAEGDVDLYSAVDGYNRQFRALYESLGLEEYFRSPRFTVGSTVHSLLQASVFRAFERNGPLGREELKYILEHGFEPARAKGLAERAQWSAANARVFGGRVLSTAPTLISRKGASICDMDLAGAYARSMDVQILPIGRPVIGQKFNRKSKRNHYENLGAFLKKYERDFVPGCWQLVISCENDDGLLELPVDQDYFASWQTPSIFEGENLLENDGGLWQERSDDVTVYTRQIFNTVLNHDGLQWIRYCASQELRNFLLKNCRVKASLWYPKQARVDHDDPQEWLRLIRESENDGRKNTCEVDVRRKKATVRVEERECHDWIGITVADLITDALTGERNRWKQFTKQYDLLSKKGITSLEQLDCLDDEQREEFHYLATEHEGGHPGGAQGLIDASLKGGKHPKDELAKLCSNTVYGDLVSRFFALSNPCVGNNITARVRSIIWYFEKGCRAWNSITDGGLFDLNEVNVGRAAIRSRLTEKNTVFALSFNAQQSNRLGLATEPLGYNDPDPIRAWGWNGDRVTIQRASGTYELEVSAAQKMVDRLTLAHVQSSFDHRIDVINPRLIERKGEKVGLFEFEAKGIVKDAAIHGTANYCLRGGKHGSYKEGKQWTIKLRSYPEATHDPILKPFFDQLIDHPDRVDRTRYWQPFTQGTVLKVRKFRDAYISAYADTLLEPGDTEYQIKIFREFTPSAFRFQTQDQRKRFLNFHQSHRDLGNHRKDAQGSAKGQSFESFFTDENGVLNYRLMMLEVEVAIRDGRHQIHPEIEIHEHPMRAQALKMKRSLWRDLVRDSRKYATVSDTIQGDFELLHENDFYLPPDFGY